VFKLYFVTAISAFLPQHTPIVPLGILRDSHFLIATLTHPSALIGLLDEPAFPTEQDWISLVHTLPRESAASFRVKLRVSLRHCLCSDQPCPPQLP